MTFSIHGLAVSRGIAIGRAVLVASSRADVAHYFIDPDQSEQEVQRIRVARDSVVEEITRVQRDLPSDAPPELAALLDVHLMLLQDEQLSAGVKHWIAERNYNAEWAITTQYEALAKEAQTKPDQREQYEKQARQLKRELEDLSNETQQVMAKRQDDALVLIYKEVQDATQRVAMSQGFDMVLSYNDATTSQEYWSPMNIMRKLQQGACTPLYFTRGMDISADVVTALNQAYGRIAPAPGAGAAPAPAGSGAGAGAGNAPAPAPSAAPRP